MLKDDLMEVTEVPMGLLEFLTKLGKALASAGISVVDITSILKRIASAYHVESEILVFPTMILIKLGEHETAPITAANPKPGLIPLNQVSELYELIYRAEDAAIDPVEGVKCIKRILSEKHLFGPAGMIVGYILFSVGIGLLMQPSLEHLIASGILGALVGTLILFGEKRTRFSVILPVIAALLVSCLFFWGVKAGLVAGSFVMLIPSLAYFLPGATLTTGMFELASDEIVSGASRVIYGAAILLLLLFGVLLGLQIMGLPNQELIVFNSATLGWWAPYLGILIFGIGMYLFMSIRNKDLPWVMLILYVAFIGEQIGNYLVGGFFGGFLGSFLMAVSGTIIEKSEHKTPSFVSILPAFWVLVPGSLGFISLATLAGQNFSASVTSGLLMILTIVSISLGLLVGAVVMEPLKNKKIV